MGSPVTNLDLLYCPREPAETVPTERVLETEGASLQKASEIALPYTSLSLVLETMRAYWTPWLGASRAKREVEKLRRRAGGEVLRLLPAV